MGFLSSTRDATADWGPPASFEIAVRAHLGLAALLTRSLLPCACMHLRQPDLPPVGYPEGKVRHGDVHRDNHQLIQGASRLGCGIRRGVRQRPFRRAVESLLTALSLTSSFHHMLSRKCLRSQPLFLRRRCREAGRRPPVVIFPRTLSWTAVPLMGAIWLPVRFFAGFVLRGGN